jgi:hypothetical protein
MRKRKQMRGRTRKRRKERREGVADIIFVFLRETFAKRRRSGDNDGKDRTSKCTITKHEHSLKKSEK